MIINENAETRRWLQVAATWRFLSLLFQSPTTESYSQLHALIGELPPEQQERARQLMTMPLEGWQAEFHRVLGPGGIPACESSYDENALAGRGPVIADIAGFYQAFAYNPTNAPAETPDHISIELGFLAYLALKIAFATYAGKDEEAQLTRDAYRRFLSDHLHYWAEPFQQAVVRAASPLYATGAEWVCALEQSATYGGR